MHKQVTGRTFTAQKKSSFLELIVTTEAQSGTAGGQQEVFHNKKIKLFLFPMF